MKKIHINASKSYDVLIKRGAIEQIGTLIANVTNTRKAVIISDDIVFALYGTIVEQSLKSVGFDTVSITFPAGENSKNLTVYEEILNFLCEKHITRSDILIALGGGVTGDLTGFIAATYLRGIDYIQIPTTLLAAVDSSVGGKTAVNLDSGKNLVGCFYQPLLVACDPNVFTTLPNEIYIDGCAEVIKYGMIGNLNFLRRLSEIPVSQQFEDVIETCVTMKRDIVQSDEFDRGKRQLLNFGHSFGHAIEKCSQFTISHGKAVAIGMAIVTQASVSLGFCDESVLNELLKILEQYGLPTVVPYSIDILYASILSDKKISQNTINLIVPQQIGKCRIEKILTKDLKKWLKHGGVK